MVCFLLTKIVPSKVAVVGRVIIRIADGNSGTVGVAVEVDVEVGLDDCVRLAELDAVSSIWLLFVCCSNHLFRRGTLTIS